MSILKKHKKLFIVIFIIIIVLYFPVFYAVKKLSYRYRIDNVFAEKVKSDLQLVSGFFGKDIIFIGDSAYSAGWKNGHSAAISWNNELVRLDADNADYIKGDSTIANTIYSIKTSNSQGDVWEKLITLNDSEVYGCDIATTYNRKIYCIFGFQLLTLYGKNEIQKKTLTKDADITFGKILAAYIKDNKLTFIWPDHRAQIPTFSFSPPFYYGPSLIMAGELNLDTLEFKEHIIGYNVKNLQDLYGKDFGKDFKSTEITIMGIMK